MSDTIIGTIIGVLSSALIFGLTSYIQWRRDERNRSWTLEDRKLERRLGVLKEKLTECREYISNEYNISAKIFNFEMRMIFS